MNYAKIRKLDVTNGEGIGVSLFVQGCQFHCKNCFNKVTWDFDNGKQFTKDTLNTIISLLNDKHIKRFSILGGEPLAEKNMHDVLQTIIEIRKNVTDITIWVYTGYTFEEVKQLKYGKEILDNVDTIVDGRYVDELRDLTLKFRGSSNQNIWKKINNVWVNTTDSLIPMGKPVGL